MHLIKGPEAARPGWGSSCAGTVPNQTMNGFSHCEITRGSRCSVTLGEPFARLSVMRVKVPAWSKTAWENQVPILCLVRLA